MSKQSNLNLKSKESGPVECLGQKFPSDDARREYYRNLLAEKLKDSKFRKIDGFPIGEDEDILELSDPPYYTACPNPWINDFILHYGRPYEPKGKYHREPFAADVSEGKNHPIYNAHSYHTKVPHRAIMRYIIHYTQPGDVVFDGFCGTGMTGVAAQLCGDRREVQELGYRIDPKGAIFDEGGNEISAIGSRTAILSDLSPAATFIAGNYNRPSDASKVEQIARSVLASVTQECGWMYTTLHNATEKDAQAAADALLNCKTPKDCAKLLSEPGKLAQQASIKTKGFEVAEFAYAVWSDIFACSDCGSEFPYWDAAVDWKNACVRKQFPCPNCGTNLSKQSLQAIRRQHFDLELGVPISQGAQMPVLINYRHSKGRSRKSADAFDLALIDKIASFKIPYAVPAYKLPTGFNTNQPIKSHGFTHVHHLYTPRNLFVIASIWDKLDSSNKWLATMMLARNATKFNRFIVNSHNPNGRINGPLAGTLYIPSEGVEQSVLSLFEDKLSVPSWKILGNVISCHSATSEYLPENSVDYIFIDPPFGGNIMYSEMNCVWESWLHVRTDNTSEAITNDVQKKELSDYKKLMALCFAAFWKALKPGRWMTVEFSNTQASVWNSIQTALQEAGFIVAHVAVIDKQHAGQKAAAYAVPVKQDLAISAYKPNGGLEERFRKSGHTVEGVWDFMRTHLRNLPVVKPRGGELEFIAERDPRILYDRMVAFYVGHGILVPLSSAEFQALLAEKFPEREGMFFLPEQVTEWDKKRAQMEGVGQMSIFVEDEKSAIDWLRNHLKTRPSTYQDIQPEFMQQLGASWKKFETRPELSLLLEQNFLKYDGNGEVPSQIHSYLSTQNKDLRNLPKDDARLQSRGKERWFVPDPGKAVDVEAVRNKRLLQEFWELCNEAGIVRPSGPTSQRTLPLVMQTTAKKTGKKKLKEVRTEAVRLGFKECFAAKDYGTILSIAAHLPDNVIEEDEQLQMMHDMAEMRAQG
jgi:DNA modification methylase